MIDSSGRMRVGNGWAPVNIVGNRYGRLVVIDKSNYRKVIARCDCGNQVAVDRRSLTTGCTKSCGCLKRELNKARFKELMKICTRGPRGRFCLKESMSVTTTEK